PASPSTHALSSSLHDALPISVSARVTFCDILPGRGFPQAASILGADYEGWLTHDGWKVYYKFLRASHQSCLRHLLRRCENLIQIDRKSTRLNSSHGSISYAVF